MLKEEKKAAYDYGRKHHLDLDDGGGGSRKAGLKYNRMWEDIDRLENNIQEKANKYAREQIVNKYGEKPVKSLERHDTMVGNAYMAAFIGTPLALATYLVATGNKR